MYVFLRQRKKMIHLNKAYNRQGCKLPHGEKGESTAGVTNITVIIMHCIALNNYFRRILILK